MKTPEVILLLSGGIDSTTLLAQLMAEGKAVHALSFYYGQRHAAELDFAKANAARYGVLVHHLINIDLHAMATASMLTNPNMPVVNYHENALPYTPNNTYVPGRNLLMLSHAAAYAEALGLKDIYFAANADDGQRFPDCKHAFIAALNQLWQSCPNTEGILLHAPFMQCSKAAVIQKSMALKVDLQQTLSCYAPTGNKACGACLSCVLKQEAMKEALNKK